MTSLIKKIRHSIFHCVLLLKVHRLRQLLPLCSMRGFCSHGAVLGTPVLHYNRCATPAKLPVCKCSVQLLYAVLLSKYVWSKTKQVLQRYVDNAHNAVKWRMLISTKALRNREDSFDTIRPA